MVYSKWLDSSELSLTELINKIIENSKNRSSEKDFFDNSELLFNVEKIFKENQKTKIDIIKFKDKQPNIISEEVEFNYIKFQYETVKKTEKNNPLRDKRIKTNYLQVIIYRIKNKNYYITNRGYNNGTLGMLRRLLGYTGKYEILEEKILGIKSELFIWLIKRLIDEPNEFLDDNNQILIQSVVGFKGESMDRLAEISGSGEKIMNMLTTLLFLFENKNISKIETKIKFDDSIYPLILGKDSFIDVNINGYLGQDFFGDREEIEAKVIIKSFLGVIPSIINIYSNELELKNWSEKKEQTFFRVIGRTLSKQINEKLKQRKEE